MSNVFEEFDDLDDRPDQTVTIGYTAPELPDDHWSKSPSWRKLRESKSVSETSPSSAPEVAADWKGCAYALSGAQEEIEETL
jgi:hypothetical protein